MPKKSTDNGSPIAKKAQKPRIAAESAHASTGGIDKTLDPSSTKRDVTTSRSIGKKQLARAAAVAGAEAPLPRQITQSEKIEYQELPHVSSVAGAALQADIVEVNKAVIRLLKTAARMGASEPLAPMLLGTSQDMIDLFFSPNAGERLLSQSIGFPLVQLRIHDVGVMRQLLSDGLVSATSVQALTKTFPLEVVQTSSRQRRY